MELQVEKRGGVKRVLFELSHRRFEKVSFSRF
jgi:hypothetical protein